MVRNFPELNWPTALLGPIPRTREIRVVYLACLGLGPAILHIDTTALGPTGLFLLHRCRTTQASHLARATATPVPAVPQGAVIR